MRWALMLGLMVLAPLALADSVQQTAIPADPPEGVKLSCTVVQDTAHAAPGPQVCDVSSNATGVNLLRARIVGVGHVWAYVDGAPAGSPIPVTPQYGTVDCATRLEMPPQGVPDMTPSRTPVFSSCSTTLATAPQGITDTFHLLAFVDGPGFASYEITLESAPVATP